MKRIRRWLVERAVDMVILVMDIIVASATEGDKPKKGEGCSDQD